jgi:hypothetical protein
MGFDAETLDRLKKEASAEALVARFAASDPKLHAELVSSGPRNESAGWLQAGSRPLALSLETMVRIGRPAFLVQDNAIVFEDTEAAAKTVTARLQDARAQLEALMPLVGRIDVAGHPYLPYVGTGWLIAPGIVVTNRHVADLIGARDGASYQFHLSPHGTPIVPTLDRRHEFERTATEPVKILRILWIQPDREGPDVAFLEIDRSSPAHIELSDADASTDDFVATIGYPARGSREDIPDQDWMDRVYRKTYDVKRIAPGQIGGPSDYGLKHDCTTLGGNSGSVVLDMKTGRATALHYAGIFRNANFAVPASTLRRLLRDRPERKPEVTTSAATPQSPPAATSAEPQASAVGPSVALSAATDETSVTINLPVTITLSLRTGKAAVVVAPGAAAVSRDDGEKSV